MFFRVAVTFIVMDAVDGRRVHCLGAGLVKPSVEHGEFIEGVTRPMILTICSLRSVEDLKILRWPEATMYMASQGSPSEKKALTFPEGSCEEEGRQPLELRRRQRREKRDATKETRAQKGSFAYVGIFRMRTDVFWSEGLQSRAQRRGRHAHPSLPLDNYSSIALCLRCRYAFRTAL